MSFITKDRNVMYKNERNKIMLNKDLFAFASSFNDAYFANDINWKKVAVHFKHTGSNQRKIIVMMDESSEGWFEASEMARTGTWEIDQIQVFDKDGDMVSVPRSDMPSPANFDITTTRKIAPAELISAFLDSTHVLLGLGKAANYEVGFKVKLWDEASVNYLDSTIYTITEISGDMITLDQSVVGYVGKILRLKFPNFNDASSRQRGIYQFVGSTF